MSFEKQSSNESENNLKSLQEQLIACEKLATLGQLTAGITHEIKNQLNFINNFAQLCEKQFIKLQGLKDSLGTRINEDEHEKMNKIITILDTNIKKIRQYGQSAHSILLNMLAIARSDPSKSFQPTNLNTLLEETFKLVYHAKRAEDPTFNIEMKMAFDHDLDEVDIIPQDISRVALNLISNSFYAITTKKNQKKENYSPIVSITTKKENDHVSIIFYDNGIGMPKEILDKLFTPFYTTKPAGQGTGLGLSLSKEIVYLGHHGDIQVESKPGEFTSFKIILPLKQVKDEGH